MKKVDLSKVNMDGLKERLTNTEERNKSQPASGSALSGIVVLCVAGFLLYSCAFSGPSETDDERQLRLEAEAAERAEREENGFHCLSAWDGSHPDFKRLVESSMRDPDSFEHIETYVTPKSKDGTHLVSMKYRARNGFGGMTIGNARGIYQNSDCTVTILSVE